MNLLRKGSIKHKLIMIGLLVSCMACLLAGTLLLIQELIVARQSFVERLNVNASIIGTNSTAALIFDDQEAAGEILNALKSSRNIVCAVLYNDKGAIFANYQRNASVEECRPHLIDPDAPHFGMEHMDILKIIRLDNEVVGSLYIKSDLREIYTQILWYALMIFVVMMVSVAFAILLLSRLQKIITKPLLDVADVIRTVSEGKNYSVRVAVQSEDEAGILAEGFNEMLSQLQKRDAEIEQHREHLQTLVAQRTEELAKTNIDLQQELADRKQAEEEKRSLEEHLNRAEKMESLGLLAGGVAHDLNNVLGIVVGYAELLLRDANHSNSIRSKLDNIMEGGKKAAAIVDDLLTLARRGVAGRNILNLNKIIADNQKSPEFNQLSSFHSSVQIKTKLDPYLLNISGSSVHLSKTIYNLVSNASEAMPKGGILTIKTANHYLDRPIQGYDEIQEGDYVVLSVSDTGEGIHEADLKRIFEPFYTKKVMGRSGTGLGLAVVWGTVKDHNGYINVESEEGKGSTFTLYFPVTREESSSEHVAVSISEYMGKGESILIVDDVKGQRDLAEEMLKRLNYTVTSVSSGEEAFAYLKEHTVDLMVLDMIMDPGMDGLDTYRQALKIHPKQKAIIVSGFSESDRVKAAQTLGAGAYVKKPYVIEKLGLAVRIELDRSV